MPYALAMGVSYNDFWEMNPHIINLITNGFKMKMDIQKDYDNFIAYVQGSYVRDALLATVGNMFSKKGAKPIEYPKEPYELGSHHELTEAEKELQRQQFFESLKTMQANFELSHNKDTNE